VLGRNPDVWMTYNHFFPEDLRIEEVVNWINKLKIDLCFLYFSEPVSVLNKNNNLSTNFFFLLKDSEGHKYGPESQEYYEKTKNADRLLRKLINMLKELNLYDKVDIVVLSDHGMATMYDPSLILLTDYVDKDWINDTKSVYGATANIYPTTGNVRNSHYLKLMFNKDLYLSLISCMMA
jgi:predicted AlkP superfamily pyrophosphatase or phosphodiesterase